MIAERVQGCRRNSVDSVRTDQFFEVHHVAVRRILGAGARPQDTLRLRALGRERLPARRREYFLIRLVGQLAVGDGNLAENRLQLGLSRGIGFLLDLFAEERVDERIDAADEEAGDTRNFADLSTARRVDFQRIDIRPRNVFVHALRKQQRDIDIDTFAQHLPNRRDAFGRARNFDHHVLAGNGSPQTARFFDRPLRVVGEIRRNFQAHIAVAAFRALVYRTQKVGGALNIAQRQ